ncbi:MAG: hydrogenase maturation nickel metallochaperone HypA [Candidatus Eisenbacteria bacterium]|nr:hydrogenase maturation nickel metallochaperone HypA [Candidatus Eisenbacteria bacterium]
MHELSLAISIREIVEQEVARHCRGAAVGRVPSVTVRIGSLSCVEPEALSFAWEVARGDETLRETALQIEVTPARALCDGCGGSFTLGHGEGQCPACGPARFSLIEGREIEVRRIVLDVMEGALVEDQSP